MNIRASGARELRKFPHFHILQLIFLSNILSVLMILCLRNIIFRSQSDICIYTLYNKCRFLLFLQLPATSLTKKEKKVLHSFSHLYYCLFARISSLFGFMKFSRGCCAPPDFFPGVLQHPQHPRFPGPCLQTI